MTSDHPSDPPPSGESRPDQALPGHAVLQVPVPALEEFVRGRYRHYDPSLLSPDPRFGHAHVTVLAPFPSALTSDDLATVETLAASTEPFGFSLREVAVFASGLIHLPPRPDDGFRALTARVMAAFPQCRPYGGRFGLPDPHLTLDQLADDVSLAGVAAEVAPWLPARARAEELQLAWYRAGESRILQRWRLGAAPLPRQQPAMAQEER